MSATFLPGLVWKTALTDNSATAQDPVGAIRWEWDSTAGLKGYRYVQAAADTTVADGTALGFSDLYKKTATSDATDTDVTPGSYYFEIEFTDAGGVVTTLAYGKLKILQPVIHSA